MLGAKVQGFLFPESSVLVDGITVDGSRIKVKISNGVFDDAVVSSVSSETGPPSYSGLFCSWFGF